MIGVAVQPAERELVAEFFELFKTAWTFAEEGGRYDVLLCTFPSWPTANSSVVLLFDGSGAFPATPGQLGATVSYAGRNLPIHGRVATFPDSDTQLAWDATTREPVIHAERTKAATFIRIGYDLFAEMRWLLTTGQPAAHAATPTLELHVALVRELITRAGLPLAEIPPAPDGHDFMACLTHDMDHPSLRNHFLDHTMFGFIFRASLGSLLNVCRGKMPLHRLWPNLAAVGALPFVYLGLAPDIWRRFEQYLAIEAGLGATYFFIPKRDYPGRKRDGPAPAKRACRYTLAELSPQLKRISAEGNELGLHGIDAWLDPSAGREEKELLASAVGAQEIGVRMHWLYFDEGSPVALDRAGFSYDSTVGYNQTVGFRAGTTQAYRPPGTTRLLELPLQVMDTALFYPSHLNLTESEALALVCRLLEDLEQFGGALTVNWHDRSIAPERLWKDFYLRFLQELKNRGAWFPTAAQAVAWFRKRRAAAFETVRLEAGQLRIRVKLDKPDALPNLKLRVHRPRIRTSAEPLATGPAAGFVDVRLEETTELSVAI